MVQLGSHVEELRKAVQQYDNGVDAADNSGQRAAIRSIAFDLLKAVSDPEYTTWQLVSNMCELVMVRVALRLEIFAAIPLHSSISNKALAEKINATESLTERVMRILVGTRMFNQTEEGHYAHTALSQTMIDRTRPGNGVFFQTLYDCNMRSMANLDEYLVDSAKDGQPVFEPTSNNENPFVHHYGQPGQNTWEVMNNRPEILPTFQLMLKSLDMALNPTDSDYDFGQFGVATTTTTTTTNPSDDDDDARVQLVDVGGGDGKVLTQILSAFPALNPRKCVLQDQQIVLDRSTPAVKAMGIQTQAVDFHVSQPVQGARAYFMRFILHDYADDAAVVILTHLRAAMAADSRLLICDAVLADRPNGGGPDSSAVVDGNVLDFMMLNIGGKERTETGFRHVLGRAGLEVRRVWRCRNGVGAVVEAVKRDEMIS